MTAIFDYLLKHDFFDETEQSLIWKELDFLVQPETMLAPESTGTAMSEGKPLKQNKGAFLGAVYQDIRVSPIYRFTNKLFESATHEYANLGFHYRSALLTNQSSILVSYYEDGDHYKAHQDKAAVTALFWFFREPKHFEGGDLEFPELRVTIPVTHNTLLLFPSQALHAVTPVQMEPGTQDQGLGRFCITRFLWTAP